MDNLGNWLETRETWLQFHDGNTKYLINPPVLPAASYSLFKERSKGDDGNGDEIDGRESGVVGMNVGGFS